MSIEMPPELTTAWDAVDAADARRLAVWDRVDQLAERIAETRRELASADADDRDRHAARLATLQAEESIVPAEIEDQSAAFADALGRWARKGLEVAEAIERDGKRRARAAHDEEQDLLTELAAVENAVAGSGPVRFADHTGELRTARPRHELTTDPNVIRLQAIAKSDRAQRDAAEEARPIRRLVAERCKVGRTTSIFGSKNAGIQTSDSGLFSDASGWLRQERAKAERLLSEAR